MSEPQIGMIVLYILGSLFLAVVGLLWLCVPFILIGIRKRLDEVIRLLGEIIIREDLLLKTQEEISSPGTDKRPGADILIPGPTQESPKPGGWNRPLG